MNAFESAVKDTENEKCSHTIDSHRPNRTTEGEISSVDFEKHVIPTFDTLPVSTVTSRIGTSLSNDNKQSCEDGITTEDCKASKQEDNEMNCRSLIIDTTCNSHRAIVKKRKNRAGKRYVGSAILSQRKGTIQQEHCSRSMIHRISFIDGETLKTINSLKIFVFNAHETKKVISKQKANFSITVLALKYISTWKTSRMRNASKAMRSTFPIKTQILFSVYQHDLD